MYDEVLPIIAPNGRTLFFVRPNHPLNLGKEDIWTSLRQPDGTWSKARNMGPPLNNADNNYVCSVTPDGNTLLLGNVYHPNGKMTPGISIVHRTATGWSIPDSLVIKNFYTHHDIGNYYLANDGRTLMLSLQRDDTHGELDLYVSFLQEDGEWSVPLNLGPDVNTRRNDRSPYLASDGKTLYFSSEGHGGYGSSDIFFSRRLDSTWTNWSRPQNLGRPINSEGEDGFFTITASGDFAYYASGQNTYRYRDIYRVLLPAEMRPHSVVLVSGKVLNASTGEPVSANIIYDRLPDGVNIGSARSNPANGEYQISLPAGSNYAFRADAKGFVAINDNIDLTQLDRYQEIERDLYLVPFEVGQTIRLNNIFFKFKEAAIQPESLPELNRVIRLLRDNPTLEIEIAGHTDSVGTERDNIRLSEDRAAAVRDYLVTQRIKLQRMSIRGYGKSEPISTNDSEEGRQRNRRVEFKILKK
jgi:OmpA-OmpF porin, OOP family